MGTKTKNKAKLNMKTTLILFALIPLVITTAIVSVIIVNVCSKELKTTTQNALVALAKETGAAMDFAIAENNSTLRQFATSPIVRDYLENPDDPEYKQKALDYSDEFFAEVEGCEGLYIADWNSKVLTHQNKDMIGVVLREGDSLSGLQDKMLASDGLVNSGIMTSPASGKLVMSMYAPVYDEKGKPIGFAGMAVVVATSAEKFSDVSSLGLKSAYTYFVDGTTGTMLYHPNEEKIGNPVENAAVKQVLGEIAGGKTPEPDVIEYVFKGENKYAGFYVGNHNAYIVVITADEADVMATTNEVIKIALYIAIGCIVVFVVLCLVLARVITKPLSNVASSMDVLSTGDLTETCDATSHIKETVSILNAFNTLKDALQSSMSNVKESAKQLDTAIMSVDTMTGNNVESVSQINEAIDEVASTSQVVATNAQTMAEKANELGVSVETLNENVKQLFEESQIIKSANDEATECMKSVYEGSNESVEAMNNIAAKIAETNEAIEKIGSAVQAIESIASQTNLLSLNASIEAARAGEAGKGFAVVADEIRTLADSSAESAKEIKQIINNIITLSNGTVEISNKVYETVSKEQEDIITTQQKFTQLSESVEASITDIDTIKRMASELNDIRTELANATENLGAVSEELGASAEEVAASCQTVTQACTDTQASTEEMRAINEHMSDAISFFKL